jgi:peptide deformylase
LSLLRIVAYPDPILSRPCETVLDFGQDLNDFAADLLAAMRAAPGVGITAAHVGRLIRLVVLELPEWREPRFYVNPEILEASSDTIRHMEGSVSMPGATEEVERPRQIRFRYRDLRGAEHVESAEGFYAVCMQHEIDQLDGIFWLRRLSRLKRDRLIRRWEKEQQRQRSP